MPIDPILARFIQEKVAEEMVYTTRELKLLLVEQVKNMFKGKKLPPHINTRYWPTLDQIRNHMHLSLLRKR